LRSHVAIDPMHLNPRSPDYGCPPHDLRVFDGPVACWQLPRVVVSNIKAELALQVNRSFNFGFLVFSTNSRKDSIQPVA
jgi:hypothetical protein